MTATDQLETERIAAGVSALKDCEHCGKRADYIGTTGAGQSGYICRQCDRLTVTMRRAA